MKTRDWLIIIMFSFYLPSKVNGQSDTIMDIKKEGRITQPQVEHLIQQFDGKESYHSKLLDVVYPSKLIVLKDGRVIVQQKNGVIIHPSINALLELLDEPDSEPIVDESFLTQIPVLIDRLSELLGVELSMNDKISDLAKADTALSRIGMGNLPEEDYLFPMVAYVGQVIANETNGMWEVRRVDDEDARLWIVGADEKEYDPFYDLDEYIRNGVEYFNLTDYVDYKLNPGEPFEADEEGKKRLRGWYPDDL
jgi:hypothetical protein